MHEMGASEFLASFFYQIFRLFGLESPFFGLTFGQIMLGLFVCELGIGIVGDLFLSIFNTSSPSSEDKFKADYERNKWYDRRAEMSRKMNFRL